MYLPSCKIKASIKYKGAYPSSMSGLHGYAQVSRHDFIEARMEWGAERFLHLIQEGRHEEAKVLFSTEEWW